MDKEKILEIEAKKNNDERLNQIKISSYKVTYIVTLIIFILFNIEDLIRVNGYDSRIGVILSAGIFFQPLFVWIKTKNKEQLILLILGLVAFILHVITYILGMF